MAAEIKCLVPSNLHELQSLIKKGEIPAANPSLFEDDPLTDLTDALAKAHLSENQPIT